MNLFEYYQLYKNSEQSSGYIPYFDIATNDTYALSLSKIPVGVSPKRTTYVGSGKFSINITEARTYIFTFSAGSVWSSDNRFGRVMVDGNDIIYTQVGEWGDSNRPANHNVFGLGWSYLSIGNHTITVEHNLNNFSYLTLL